MSATAEGGAKGAIDSGATAVVAKFITTADTASVPALGFERAKKVIADSFACILSGAGSEVAQPMLAFIEDKPEGSRPVLGTARTAAPDIAALVNGTFGAALDYDDLLSPTHPSAPIVAALCSAMQPGKAVTGARFIDAYIVGLEVGAKIAQALGRGHSQRGFHATATLTGFSALGAIARLNRLPPEQIQIALGLVATHSGGLMCALGTMAKPLHSGLAAQHAINAARMAQVGVTASPVALETRRGYFEVYGDAKSDAAAIAPSLGNRWAIVEPGPTLKRFPSCIAEHRAMAAVLDLKRQGLNADNVASLDCSVAPEALQPLMYPRPTTGLEAKFSMPYAIAATLLHDRITIEVFETPATQLPAVQRLMDMVTAWEDPQQVVEDPVAANLSWGFRGYARVTATLKDGRKLVSRVDVPPGHPSNELTWDDLRDKFADCAASARLDVGSAEAAFRDLERLQSCGDVETLLGRMCKKKS